MDSLLWFVENFMEVTLSGPIYIDRDSIVDCEVTKFNFEKKKKYFNPETNPEFFWFKITFKN